MSRLIKEVMTTHLVSLPASASIRDAAESMKQNNIGAVLVTDKDRVCGIVTDRDILVRAVADNKAPGKTTLGEICSGDLATLGPDDTTEQAATMMRQRSLRRILIMDANRPVGIVSIGDLAMEMDPRSALASISGAPANR